MTSSPASLVAGNRDEAPMVGGGRTEQTIGLVILAILAIACVLRFERTGNPLFAWEGLQAARERRD
jgi:hypothetical protein